jgi:acetyl-CoA carboxylase biotin carboxyl carrier protein
MGADELARIAAWMAAGGISEMELCDAGGQVRVRLGVNGATESISPPQSAGREIAARAIGTVRLGHPLRRAPFVKPGDRVRRGDILALVQSSTVLGSVLAPADGVVGTILVRDGATVDFATLLFVYA